MFITPNSTPLWKNFPSNPHSGNEDMPFKIVYPEWDSK